MLRELYKCIYELYECTSEGSDCLQKRFDGILFSSLLQEIPKEHVLNRNTALTAEFTENSCKPAGRI